MSGLPLLEAYLESVGNPLSEEALERFTLYREALYKANETTNLTRVPFDGCETRHFLDSVLPIDLIPLNASVLDVGTGPGLPAWPLACARPDLRVTAIDGAGKMIRFLTSQPLPNLVAIQGRAEDLEERALYDVVLGRALAPLAIQLELSAPHCKLDGLVLPYRSALDKDAARNRFGQTLGIELERLEERILPGVDVTRLFPLYRKARSGSPKYPRSWAQIKSSPL